MGLVLEEQVEPKGFQVQEEAEGNLEEEAKERHVDPDLGGQLEHAQEDWDTGGKKY
jgi:hypothetical protein